MTPAAICKQILGAERLQEILEQLSAPQIKSVLKEGKLKAKLPGGFVNKQKRRRIWSTRIVSAVETDNDEACAELLQQWLLNHERQLLIDYLDLLEVKHRAGETDDSFLFSRPAERAREAGKTLRGKHDTRTVAAYLAYIAHQQKSNVFDDTDLISP